MSRPGRKPNQKSVSLPSVQICEVGIENPMFAKNHREDKANPRRIKAQFNEKESYVGYLYARGSITNAQFRAANDIRKAYEDMGGAGAKAIDYEQAKVDGGQIAQTICDKHLRAAKKLKQANRVLGSRGYELTQNLAGLGMWPNDILGLQGTNEQKRYLRERFKECLETLAIEFGYQSR